MANVLVVEDEPRIADLLELYLTRAGLARRLGGEASAGHAPEGGAKFSIEIPLSCEDTER